MIASTLFFIFHMSNTNTTTATTTNINNNNARFIHSALPLNLVCTVEQAVRLIFV